MSVHENRATGVIFVLACAFAVVAVSLWTADPDVFWHLAVGKWISQNGTVPRADVYSWSAYGQPWTAHQWLWELILYQTYNSLGVVGMWSLVFACAAWAGLLVRAGLLASGVSPGAASVAGGMAPVLLWGWLKPWPQAGVYALFGGYLYLSLRGRWGLKEVFLAFGLAALWANVHSSAVLLPGFLLAEWVWRRLTHEETGMLALAAVASFAGLLVNPYGAGLAVYAVREGLLTNMYRRHIAEWMPYYFGSPELASAFFVSAAVIIGAAVHGKLRSLEFCRAGALWAAALMSRIWMPYAVLSTAALAGRITFRFRPVLLAASLVAALGGFVFVVRGVPPDLDAVASRARYPVAAAAELKKLGARKPFNDYGFGGYLIWKGIPVYIDGRADLYRYRDILKRYLAAPEEEEDLARYVAATGADSAVVVRHGFFDRALSAAKEWERVYADEAAALYRRRPGG